MASENALPMTALTTMGSTKDASSFRKGTVSLTKPSQYEALTGASSPCMHFVGTFVGMSLGALPLRLCRHFCRHHCGRFALIAIMHFHTYSIHLRLHARWHAHCHMMYSTNALIILWGIVKGTFGRHSGSNILHWTTYCQIATTRNITHANTPAVLGSPQSKKECKWLQNTHPFVTHVTSSHQLSFWRGPLSTGYRILCHPKLRFATSISAAPSFVMSSSIQNMLVAYKRYWLPLMVLGTSLGFVHWPPEHRRMFSFGIVPKRSQVHYMDYEIGSMDGAYKGCLHVAWPFIGRKTLRERQKEYNDHHGFYRAHVEHLFARMWHWGVVRNIWRGSGTELHEYVRILLHLQQFLIPRQVEYPPYGPWENVSAHV